MSKSTFSRIIWVSAIVFALTGVAIAQDKPPKPASRNVVPQKASAPATAVSANSVTNSGLRVIGYIEKRGRTITIKAGPKGPVYSVKNAEGKVLFENLSAEQLRVQAPELHEFIKTAVAGSNSQGKKSTITDASLERLHR